MVEECTFNERHACVAESIEVASNGNDIVGTKNGTLCLTFHYRDFDDAGIHRSAKHPS